MKRNNIPNNKYSFLTYSKSDIIDLEYDNNAVSKYNPNDKDNSSVDIKLYSFHDDKIIQEYCFETDDTSLYFSTENDNELALVYQSEYNSDENVTVHYIYQPDGMYTATQNNDGTLSSIIYIDAKNFQKINKKCEQFSNIPILKKLNNFTSDLIVAHKAIVVATSNKVVENETSIKLYDKFKDLFKKYSLAVNYIPASCIIQDILEIVNHYIATGELDKNTLLNNYIQLQNFQEICSSSIKDISQFVQNPSNTDLRNLCDNLNSRLKNLEYFVNLYLEKELKENLEK